MIEGVDSLQSEVVLLDQRVAHHVNLLFAHTWHAELALRLI